MEASNKFFSLPLEEKRKLDMKQYPGFRGYDAIGTQKYDDSLPDLKEVSTTVLHLVDPP